MAETPPRPPGATTVAAIDIGSGAIRMVIAQVLGDPPASGRLEVLERAQQPMALGQDAFESGQLRRRTINAAIGVLNGFRKVLDTYGVHQVRAVATSAVREAANADVFVDRVYTACGLDVEVISPSEESRLRWLAVREALKARPDVAGRDTLIVEVGGGSSSLTFLHGGAIVTAENYRLGSVRLTEALSIGEEPPQRAADLIRHQIAGVMSAIAASMPLKKVQTYVAMGSEARLAAREAGQPAGPEGLHVIRRRAFDRLVGRCAAQAPQQLAKRYDLPYAEAETLVPGLLVYQELLHATGAREVLVARCSMRDGLLLDAARLAAGKEDEELTAEVMRSAASLAEKYRCDMPHAQHVTEMAMRLFDEVRAGHGLTGRHRLLLRVAGLLHEVGGFVSTRAHHKHSYYLIANSEVFGLNREETEMVALVARYHRRSAPKKTHLEYMALPRDRRVEVSKLAALLRVADALDRGHAQQVRDFRLERRPGELVISVPGAGDLTLERRALDGKAALFEEVFGMTVRLEEAPLAAPSPAGPEGRT